MKHFLSILLTGVQIFSSVATATTPIGILIPSPDVSEEEYNSALSAFKNYISVEEWERNQSPTSPSIQKLIQKFSEAEASFTDSRDPAEIQKKYSDLLELEMTEDWGLNEQRIFFLSYLRLLQTNQEDLSAERKSYLDHAAFYLTRMDAPRNLIPPPLVREVEDRKAQLKWEPQNLSKEIVANYSKVLIMGKSQSTKEPLVLPRDLQFPIRFRFLSSYRPAKTKVISPTELSKVTLKQDSYVPNGCGSQSLRDDQAQRFSLPTKIYEPLHCSVKAKSSDEQKGIAVVKSTEVTLPGLSSQGSSSWKMKPKHWAWLGVGSVAAALLISQLKKKNEPNRVTSPGETQGF